MNDKLRNLWLEAHIAVDDEYYYSMSSPALVMVDDVYHEADAVIATLKFVYNCFGLPEPLKEPTTGEMNAHRTSKNERRAA